MTYRQGSPPSLDHQQSCLYCGETCFEGATECACGASAPPPRASLPETLWCARCGGQQLATTPAGHRCKTCGGLFVGAKEWTQLLARTTGADASPPMDGETPPLSQPHLSYTARCPACGGKMDRAVFAAHSGVTVDVCNAHGIWLDTGELPAIILALRRLPDGAV